MKKLLFLLMTMCCFVVNTNAATGLVKRNIAHISKVKTPSGSRNFPDPATLTDANTKSNICEGQDTVFIKCLIYPKAQTTTSFNCFMQTRKDNETQWVKKGSTWNINKTSFNNAYTSSGNVQVEKTWFFDWNEAPQTAQYFRFCLINGTDTLYSNEVEINPRYRITILGPVRSYTNINGSDVTNRIPESPLSFGTHSQEVRANDTIYFKALGMNGDSYYDIKTGGCIILAEDGHTACAADFSQSATLDLSSMVQTYKMSFYVDGQPYKTFDKMLCDWTPDSYGYTLEDPDIPGVTFLGYWQTRGTTGEDERYTAEEILDIEGIEDIVFDAYIDEKYDLWIKGVQVTTSNSQNILGDGAASFGIVNGRKLLTIKGDISCTSGVAIKSDIRNLYISFKLTFEHRYITVSSTTSSAIQVSDTTIITDNLVGSNECFVTISGNSASPTNFGLGIDMRGDAHLIFDEFHGTVSGKAFAIKGQSSSKDYSVVFRHALEGLKVKLENTEEGGQPMTNVNNVVLSYPGWGECEYADPQVTFKDLGSTLGYGFAKNGSKYDATLYGPLEIRSKGDDSAIDEIELNDDETKIRKELRNGQILILHNGKAYNVLGVEVE